MVCDLKSEKLSAQSPPCSKKASPRPTLANFSLSVSASPAKIRGGNDFSCFSTSFSAS